MSGIGNPYPFPSDDLDAYQLLSLGIPPDHAIAIAARARAAQTAQNQADVPRGLGSNAAGVFAGAPTNLRLTTAAATGSPDPWAQFPSVDESDLARFGQGGAGLIDVAAHLSARNKSYLDRYANSVMAHSNAYGVDPTFLLGLGCQESGCGSQGTYTKTNDAFGMTNGGTTRMNRFPAGQAGVDANVQRFFDLYGQQIHSAGSDESAFLNAIEGRDASGRAVPGWHQYNSNPRHPSQVHDNIRMMQRDLPIWQQLQQKDSPNP